MAQHDMNIANQFFPDARTDINNALAALNTNNSGNSAPASPQQCQNYFNLTTPSTSIFMEYVYSGTAWVPRGKLDSTLSRWINQGYWDLGSVSAPAIAFTPDTDTGIYSVGDGSIDFAVNGVRRASLSTNVFYSDALQGMTQQAPYLRTRDGRWGQFQYEAGTTGVKFFLDGADIGYLLRAGNLIYVNMQNWGTNWAMVAQQSDLNYSVFFVDAISDERLKTNIQPTSEDALAKLCSIDIVQFDWKKTGEHASIGYIAQQLRDRVSPDLVGGDEFLVPNAKALIPWLIRAVQQLEARVRELENARS